jgi:hypothetical protein
MNTYGRNDDKKQIEVPETHGFTIGVTSTAVASTGHIAFFRMERKRPVAVESTVLLSVMAKSLRTRLLVERARGI